MIEQIPCQKQKFSKRKASRVLTQSLLAQLRPTVSGDTNRHEQGIYRCEECRSWHLTSQSEIQKETLTA
jgi:hypothetical protein